MAFGLTALAFTFDIIFIAYSPGGFSGTAGPGTYLTIAAMILLGGYAIIAGFLGDKQERAEERAAAAAAAAAASEPEESKYHR